MEHTNEKTETPESFWLAVTSLTTHHLMALRQKACCRTGQSDVVRIDTSALTLIALEYTQRKN